MKRFSACEKGAKTDGFEVCAVEKRAAGRVTGLITINTERLTIAPMTKSEIEGLIEQNREKSPEMSNAYKEMLDGCVAYPSEYLWYCVWRIALKDTLLHVGDASFKGYNNGSPEIGYGINGEHQGMGYATEAISALCKWAFSMPGIVAVEAETEVGNEKSKRVLLKVGFIPTGKTGYEGPRYILNLPSSCA